MKNTLIFSVLSIALLLTSCSKESNPVIEEPVTPPREGGCSFAGLEVDFTDTCSYNFITSFISGYDSLVISHKALGADFTVYADSGSFSYWKEYFNSDPTIETMFEIQIPGHGDSLFIIFRVSGERTVEEETERFLETGFLEIISIEHHDKFLFLDVTEEKAAYLTEHFEQFSFIEEVFAVGVCEEALYDTTFTFPGWWIKAE